MDRQSINLKLTGRPTRVDDVYGTSVYLREFTTARKVFSQNVELENASSVDQSGGTLANSKNLPGTVFT